MFDRPLVSWVSLLVVDTIHQKDKRSSTGVKIKT